MLADTATDDTNVAFWACDFEFNADKPACRDNTDGTSIERLAAKVRVHAGDVDSLPILEVPKGLHAVLALDREAIDDDHRDVALEADVLVEQVRHLSMQQGALGVVASTDVGDGTKPFSAVVDADLRAKDPDERRIVADATITPLPRTLDLTYAAPGEDQTTSPLHATFDSFAVADVTGAFSIFEQKASDRCGDPHSLCGTIGITRLPKHADIVLAEVPKGIGEGKTQRTTTLDVIATPHQGQLKPNLTATITVGPESFGSSTATPLVIDAGLNGFPEHTSVRLVDTDQLVDPFNGDPDDLVLGPVTHKRHLDSVDVHTCEWKPSGQTCPLDENDKPIEGQLDELKVSARTFLFRPAQFPPPPEQTTPLFASIVGRGSLWEAAAHVTDIREVRFVSKETGEGDETGSVLGGRLRLGDGKQPMFVNADIGGLRVGEFAMAGKKYDDAIIDATLTTTIDPLPNDITFCKRDAGIKGSAASNTNLTGRCENSDPSSLADPLVRTPLSLAYDANGTVTKLTGDTAIHIRDNDKSPAALHIGGHLEVDNLPKVIEAHVVLPETQGEGPTLVTIDTEQGVPARVVASANILVGDAVCGDPRDATEATCVGATLVNLPKTVDLRFDPQASGDNFELVTTGNAALDVNDLTFAHVEPKTADAPRDVVIASGQILGVPKDIRGRIAKPTDGADLPDVDVRATSAVTDVLLSYQNFVAPDPLPKTAPAVRTGVTSPDDYVHVFQRGDAVRANVHVGDLLAVGANQKRDGDDKVRDTMLFHAGFASDQDLRAYADLQPSVDSEGPLAGARIIVDATLQDVPANLDMCISGAQATDDGSLDEDGKPSLDWCDHQPGGGVQVIGQHAADEPGVDVDAFVRIFGAKDIPLLAAVLDLDDVPAVVRAQLPGPKGLAEGTLDVAVFDAAMHPAGIGRIAVKAATFDFPNLYPEKPRYAEQIVDEDTFTIPAADLVHQHLAAVMVDGDFLVDARLGTTTNEPASRLQHLAVLPEACAAPANKPADYPRFPDDEFSHYHCTQLGFQENSPQDDPLSIYLIQQTGPRQLALRNAGLSNVPPSLQITTTSTRLYSADKESKFRAVCRSAKVEPESADSAAPLMRFDQPANSILYGDLTYLENTDDALQLAFMAPEDPDFLPNMNASPGADGSGWSDWDEPLGARIKVARINDDLEDGDGDGVVNGEDDEDRPNGQRIGASASFRLNLPQSLTIDQIQKWAAKDPAGTENGTESSDLSLRFAVRDSDGKPAPSLGRAAALLLLDDGMEVALAGPDKGPEGLQLPSEFGFKMFKRTQAWDLESKFIQLDGRASQPTSIGVRLNKDLKNEPTNNLTLALSAAIRNVPGFAGLTKPEENLDPTFSVLFEKVGDGPTDKYDSKKVDDCTATKCDLLDMAIGVNLDINFQTEGLAEPTRRIEAYVRQGMPADPVIKAKATWKSTQNGIRLSGFKDVEGTLRNPISGQVSIEIDPLRWHRHRGVYGLGSKTLNVDGSILIPVKLDRVYTTDILQNLLHVFVSSDNEDGGGVTLTPETSAEIRFNDFSFEVWGLFLPIVNFYWNSGGELAVYDWKDCDQTGFTSAGTSPKASGGDTEDVILWPISKGQFFVHPIIAYPLVNTIVAPILCNSHKPYDIPVDRPKPDYLAEGHPVPRVGVGNDAPTPLPDEPDPVQPPAVVAENETVALCGVHYFDKLSVKGKLRIAKFIDETSSFKDANGIDVPNCKENPGELTIIATELDVDPAAGDAERASPACLVSGRAARARRAGAMPARAVRAIQTTTRPNPPLTTRRRLTLSRAATAEEANRARAVESS